MLVEPVPIIGDESVDEGHPNAYLTRRPQRMVFTDTKATVDAQFDLDVTLSNAGQAVHGIRWV